MCRICAKYKTKYVYLWLETFLDVNVDPIGVLYRKVNDRSYYFIEKDRIDLNKVIYYFIDGKEMKNSTSKRTSKIVSQTMIPYNGYLFSGVKEAKKDGTVYYVLYQIANENGEFIRT